MAAAAILGAQQAGAQILEWASSYNGIPASAVEEVEGVVVDAAGNVFATGLSGNGTGSAICTMKLSPRGTILWTLMEAKASLCGGMWGRTPLTQDAAGNLIVVGAEFTNDMSNWNPLLLKYSPKGATLQREVFDLGPFASFDGVAAHFTEQVANDFVADGSYSYPPTLPHKLDNHASRCKCFARSWRPLDRKH